MYCTPIRGRDADSFEVGRHWCQENRTLIEKMKNIPELSVVVPVHNEAENIDLLVSEIRNALQKVVDYELIYVDDGSTDDTFPRLMQLAKGFDRLRILRHASCCGQSAALWTGVNGARAEWIATLDGDGQNDPVDIPVLTAYLKDPDRTRGLALICGHRHKRRDTAIKRISSRTANKIRAFLLKDSTPDTGCGLKVFSREAFLRLPFFDHMHRFLPALVLRGGGRVASIKVNHRPRLRGTSHYGIGNRLWVGIIDLLGVMWLQHRIQHPKTVEETPVED